MSIMLRKGNTSEFVEKEREDLVTDFWSSESSDIPWPIERRFSHWLTERGWTTETQEDWELLIDWIVTGRPK